MRALPVAASSFDKLRTREFPLSSAYSAALRLATGLRTSAA